MRMFKCIDHNYPLKRWEMLYIHKKFHQIKLSIVANYEWGIIELKIGQEMKPITSFFSTKEKEGGNFILFFLLQTVVEIWEKEVGTVKIPKIT
jgi:hypothetical protein